MRPTRRLWLTVAGVGALGALWFWRARTEVMDVELATARRGEFVEYLVEDGRTRARWHLDITAPVAGEWVPLPLQPGATVATGAVLGTLGAAAQDPATAQQARARVGVARAALEAASATVVTAAIAAREAERARERAERLERSGGVSQEELDKVRAEDEARRSELEAARALVSAAEYELTAARAFETGGAGRRVQLRAPFDGVVLRVDEEHTRVVPAGAPLLQVGALGELEVVTRVLSADAPRVRTGAELLVIVGTDTLRGHVIRIEPTAQTVRSALGVDEQRVAIIGDVHAGDLRVGHDFQVDVRIVVGRLADEVLVPSGALVRRGSAWYVFAVDSSGRVSEREVQVLGRGGEQSAVTGVREGEQVVVYPGEGVERGIRVQ